MPNELPKGKTQNLLKSLQKPNPKATKILIYLGFEFLSILVPFWEPSWSHVSQFFRAKTAQEASKTSQDASKTPQGASQDGLVARIRPDPLQASILIDF